MRFLVEKILSISLVMMGIGQGHAAQPKAGGPLEPVLTLLNQGKIEEGERMLRQRLKENPDDSAARRLLGRVADFDGRPDEAVKTWEEGLKQTAEDFPLLMEIGQIRARQGRDGPTISYRRGMVTAQPGRDKAAEEKFKQEHFALAAKAFERALALVPDQHEAALELAKAYSDSKNYEAAVKVWRRLHELNGDRRRSDAWFCPIADGGEKDRRGSQGVPEGNRAEPAPCGGPPGPGGILQSQGRCCRCGQGPASGGFLQGPAVLHAPDLLGRECRNAGEPLRG